MHGLRGVINNSTIASSRWVHWKYISLSCITVCIFAYIQHTYVIRVPLKWENYIIPAIVGGVFGFLIARIRLLNAQLIDASLDPLTRLWGRRYFNEVLYKEIEASKRYRSSLSLMIIDIDDFKYINDHFGHQAGDSVLKEFAAVINKNQRGADTYARWGGEEFIVLMPRTSTETARVVAERLRKSFEEYNFSHIKPVTASIGIAEYQVETDTVDSLITRADNALYQAKDLGKNRIVAATGV